MKVGIIGTGAIGGSLITKLSAAGHDVKAANSRGPDTVDPALLTDGARAATVEEAMTDVDVVILSIPLEQMPPLAPLIGRLPDDTVVIDTSNYYPYRTGGIAAIEAGQVESEWVVEQLGRPITKAWNAVGAASLANKGQPAGTTGRIALPVAGDREQDRKVAMALVEDTGFDGFDAGPLADSWRQQPGAPGYCTDLTREELTAALAATERERLPKRRDLLLDVVMERVDDGRKIDGDYVVRLGRAIFM